MKKVCRFGLDLLKNIAYTSNLACGSSIDNRLDEDAQVSVALL